MRRRLPALKNWAISIRPLCRLKSGTYKQEDAQRLRSLAVIVIAYLLGAIPFGYLIVRARSAADIRETGSGGTGATNVSRRAGKAAGVLTLVLDALKGAAAVLIARFMLSDSGSWAIAGAAILVIIGHMF